jgi:hypothetical protein
VDIFVRRKDFECYKKMKSALGSVPIMLVGVVGFGAFACGFFALTGYVLAGGWLVALFGVIASALSIICLLYAIAGIVIGSYRWAWEAWMESCREQEARNLKG